MEKKKNVRETIYNHKPNSQPFISMGGLAIGMDLQEFEEIRTALQDKDYKIQSEARQLVNEMPISTDRREQQIRENAINDALRSQSLNFNKNNRLEKILFAKYVQLFMTFNDVKSFLNDFQNYYREDLAILYGTNTKSVECFEDYLTKLLPNINPEIFTENLLNCSSFERVAKMYNISPNAAMFYNRKLYLESLTNTNNSKTMGNK